MVDEIDVPASDDASDDDDDDCDEIGLATAPLELSLSDPVVAMETAMLMRATANDTREM